MILSLKCMRIAYLVWTQTLQDGESRNSGNGKTSRVTTRKHVIVGVTCAVVIAMVITGVLVGVKFHLDSTSEIITVCIFITIIITFHAPSYGGRGMRIVSVRIPRPPYHRAQRFYPLNWSTHFWHKLSHDSQHGRSLLGVRGTHFQVPKVTNFVIIMFKYSVNTHCLICQGKALGLNIWSVTELIIMLLPLAFTYAALLYISFMQNNTLIFTIQIYVLCCERIFRTTLLSRFFTRPHLERMRFSGGKYP